MNSLTAGWYVVYTRSHHEKKVAFGLSQKDIRYFLPTVKALRTWNDRKKYISVPMFPSYVFVYINDKRDYFSTLDTYGVLYYVKTGKEITRVSDQVIDNICLVVEGGNDIEVSAEYFRPQQQFFIQQGPLTGLSCEVVKYNGG
ncbi:MAG TPA: UpxY family transcription antiterminator, partial [Flavipsychrobacter sp.]|nr:UpxY family transcription antiterminator [Flavipsychrobacter sp.]